MAVVLQINNFVAGLWSAGGFYFLGRTGFVFVVTAPLAQSRFSESRLNAIHFRNIAVGLGYWLLLGTTGDIWLLTSLTPLDRFLAKWFLARE